MTSQFIKGPDEEEAKQKADTSVVQFPGTESAAQRIARTTGPGLPPPTLKRWTPQYKEAVVLAVNRGFLTLREACIRYALSVEEFQDWENAISKHGKAGLKVTRISGYRRSERRTAS